MAAFLFVLFMLIEPLQNAILEILLTFASNLWLCIYHFAGLVSIGLLVCLVILTLVLVIFYFWYEERQKHLERKNKKKRIAVRDALRARKYFKQYMEAGTFDPGQPARDQGIFFKEKGPFHRDTYQEGTGQYDDEESKLASHILKEHGFLPYTATIAAPPDDEDFTPEGYPKTSAVISTGLLTPEFYDNRMMKKPDPKKKGKRKAYGVYSNAFMAPEKKIVPVSKEVEDMVSIYSNESLESRQKMMELMRAELDEKIVQDVADQTSVSSSTTEVGVLHKMTKGWSTLIGGVLPVSWGRLEGKQNSNETLGDSLDDAAKQLSDNPEPIDYAKGLGQSGSLISYKSNSSSAHSTRFKALDGMPVPSEKATRHKKKKNNKSKIEYKPNTSQEVQELDALQARRDNALFGSSKPVLAAALAGGMNVQSIERNDNKGMPIDGEGHMINLDVQPDKRGVQVNDAGIRLDDGGSGDDLSLGTFQSTRSGKAPKSAHRNTERHKGDKKNLAIKLAKAQKLAEADDASSVGGGSLGELHPYEKADGPGAVALDEKASMNKYEAAAGATSSTQQLLLPLRDALHELASLKVLNPEMASDTLVPKGLSRPAIDTMTTHSNKPRKRASKRSKRDKSTKILKAGGASVASQAQLSSLEGSSLGDGTNSMLDDDTTVHTSLPNPMDNPIEEKPGTKSANAGQVHAYIKEKGRLFQYSSIKEQKKKVLGRLLPPDYPNSPLAAGSGTHGPPVGSPTVPKAGSPNGFAPSQRIDRSDPGPSAILPWRDTVEKKEIDVEHMVAPTGVYFVTPNPDTVPAPRRPHYVEKVVARQAPAAQVELEHAEMPKHPLFS